MVTYEIDTSLYKNYFKIGVPSKIARIKPFSLANKLQPIEMSNNKAITVKNQLSYYNFAVSDDSGWFMVIQTSGLLDIPKHIAISILNSYVEDGLTASWVSSFYAPIIENRHLYVLDALFEDDSTTKRAKIYELLLSMNNPSSSIILLSRASSLNSSLFKIGVRPHMVLSVKE